MIFTTMWLFISLTTQAQNINIANGKNITNGTLGNCFASSWSDDGNYLLFISLIDENNNRLCFYDIIKDTVTCISEANYDFNNPIWHPDGRKIVFDSDKNGVEYLYAFDIETKAIHPLFNRKIRCRNASFSASSRQVYFTGYDELADRWEIYSYDFIYDNLNKLSDYKLGCSNPEVSNNGKLIAYCKENPFNATKHIDIINWYGEPTISFNEFDAEFPKWSSSGFKLYFMSHKEIEEGEIYSIWKDGSHLERLTNDILETQDFSISPDETKIAVSVLTDNGLDIFIIPIEEY